MSVFQNGQLTVGTFELTGNDLQLLYNVLDEMPGKVGRPLHQKLQAQAQRQLDEYEKQRADAAAKQAKDLREQHRAELLEEQKKASEAGA